MKQEIEDIAMGRIPMPAGKKFVHAYKGDCKWCDNKNVYTCGYNCCIECCKKEHLHRMWHWELETGT
jgi:hypothetical protein